MLRVIESLGGGIVRGKARRLSRRFFLQTQDCQRTQAATLARLLRLNAGSRYQYDHRLSPRTTVDELRRQVPISDYPSVASYIESLKAGDASALCGPLNPVRMFALSSGTTGDTKFIPITRQFLKDYRRGWTIWGINTFDDHPRLHRLKILQLASDHDRFRTSAAIPCGNISGLVQSMQSRFFRFKYTLPAELLQITDPPAKYYTLLRLALADRNVGLVMTANPSTLVHLAREMNRQADTLLRDIHDGTLAVEDAIRPPIRESLARCVRIPNPQRARELAQGIESFGQFRPRDAWPQLTVAGIWTGGSASAYLPAVRAAYGEIAIRDHGLSASEGRMTIPFEDNSASGVLDVGTHFFEFIPEEQIELDQPDTLLAHQLRAGETYFILLTTASGLCRYDIRDVVRCTGHVGTTPVLEFLHKGAHIANVTGEKVTESQVVAAVNSSTARLSHSLTYYTVTPVWGAPPAYRLLVEEQDLSNPGDAERLAALVDLELQQLNCEYADKRVTGRLSPLTALTLPSGTWAALIRQLQSQPGGSLEQYKHPCLKPELDFAETVLGQARHVRQVRVGPAEGAAKRPDHPTHFDTSPRQSDAR